LIDAERHLPLLVLSESPALAAALVERRLAPLDSLTPRARERMRETALACVRSRGNAAEMARKMQVHPQTARYRLARLRELLDDRLDDPDVRLELELALEASA
jgi:DNA-binding PucR family transcriptional regulator